MAPSRPDQSEDLQRVPSDPTKCHSPHDFPMNRVGRLCPSVVHRPVQPGKRYTTFFGSWRCLQFFCSTVFIESITRSVTQNWPLIMWRFTLWARSNLDQTQRSPESKLCLHTLLPLPPPPPHPLLIWSKDSISRHCSSFKVFVVNSAHFSGT